MLGYWNAHLKNPERVLFLKYEDLKGDILSNVKKIAEFMGFPFSAEEEKQGVVEQISRLCSFENLKNLEVNKSGNVLGLMKNSSFFRKGEVGDWVNYLSPEMAERVKNIMESKFQGSGLIFNI
ncbi:UNVERIFIED_CONTAM: Cytosolic sulfotransferase 14 [Sesamum radiatum]